MAPSWSDFVWEPKLPVTFMQRWAADAENIGVWTPRRARCMPLVYFPDEHLIDIRMDVEDDKKPAYWLDLGIAQIPSRSWLEWHWQRGVDPDARRPAIPVWIRQRVLDRDGLLCQICLTAVEATDVHLDHIKPWSRGGEHTVSNLQVTHSRCNLRKWAHYVEVDA